jgi:RimJ/RimL family protein N-acetyltransferase
MELLRTERLLLRRWDESDLAAFFDLYSREGVARWLGAHPRRPLAGKAGIDQVLAITDVDNAASQRVATRLGMTDEGVTERWFGLTARQYRKVITPTES